MFETSPEFLILIEVERIIKKDISSALRLLISTKTYLEWPGEGNDLERFWFCLKESLGPPLATTQARVSDIELNISEDDICLDDLVSNSAL
jgi:hypothetical protein